MGKSKKVSSKVSSLLIAISAISGFRSRDIKRYRRRRGSHWPRSRSQTIMFMARKASHLIPGCDDRVGPRRIYFYRRTRRVGKIPRRLMVFGVGSFRGSGGFGPLLHVRFVNKGLAHLVLNLSDAQTFDAQQWLGKFVLEICGQAGWRVQFIEYRQRYNWPRPQSAFERRRMNRFNPRELAQVVYGESESRHERFWALLPQSQAITSPSATVN